MKFAKSIFIFRRDLRVNDNTALIRALETSDEVLPIFILDPEQLDAKKNRYKSDIQMGFQRPIVDSVDAAIAVDTMWYGGNSQCAALCGSTTNQSLTQKPLTTIQAGPIYKINQIYTVAATYFYVAGGATLINNQYQNNVINTQRYLLSGQAHTPIGRFSLQYGRDMEIKNRGFFLCFIHIFHGFPSVR